MDTQSIIIIVGLTTLIIERIFSCINRIRTSKCCGGELVLTPQESKKSLKEMENNTDKKIGTENITEFIPTIVKQQ